MAASLELRHGKGFGHDDLWRFRSGARRGDERLESGVGEELLELSGRFSFVDDEGEVLPDTDLVVNAAPGPCGIDDLLEFCGALAEVLTERGGVPCEFGDN